MNKYKKWMEAQTIPNKQDASEANFVWESERNTHHLIPGGSNMAISSAMYTAVTGLSALGTGMQTISNNIANVNTVGFKAGRTNYEDLISQNYFSGGGGRVNQRGCGVKVSSIQSLFSQGAFMASAQDTDLAIAGEGFFAVRNVVRNDVMYTRAGNFTLNKDGYIEDPSGNILQGWQMSIPRPGEEAIRIGAPVDVKITVLNAPPMETSHMKVVVNLNADAQTSYNYEECPIANELGIKEGLLAKESAEKQIWDEDVDVVSTLTGAFPKNVNPSSKPAFDELFIERFNEKYGVSFASPISGMSVYADGSPIDATDRALGKMTETEFNDLVTSSLAAVRSEALLAGESAYKLAYDNEYAYVKSQIDAILPSWKSEGSGFAGAWNPQDVPHIDTSDGMIYEEPMIVFDSLGSEHKLNVYYQKNPFMANVWDYIVTCDPIEDARKDANTPRQLLLSNPASFSGLIQKGKITFSADGDDRHGGQIKDIEAQNIDLDKSFMAVADKRDDLLDPNNNSPAMVKATIGGYYTGESTLDSSTFEYAVSGRTYKIAWGAPTTATSSDDFENTPSSSWTKYVNSTPLTEGLSWWNPDDPEEFGFIAIEDVNNIGPYNFGAGLNISFDNKTRPLNFGVPGEDAIQIDATSELMAWENIDPNEEGYFDFDVAFVQSASMALHPPYPSGMPTVVQNITLDMGAKRNFSNTSQKWILDDQSTTQYAAKFSTVFAGQDGFAPGSLQRVSVGEDGVITGVYSNGRQQSLYQVGLTRFLNPWGLSKEGDNLFSETRYSGQGTLNEPGYGGTGTVLGNFLEQSNVDVAEEIVNMILTQRGFQANSKTVTTTDTMLAEVIEMKR